MFCESCGKSISDLAISCPQCGQPTGIATSSKTGSVSSRLPSLTNPRIESGIAGICRPFLQPLEDGKVLRTLIALFLRIVGVCAVLGVLFLDLELVKTAFQTQSTQLTIAFLLVAALSLVAGVATFFIYFYRAASIASLGDSPFTVIPIVSLLCRAAGEVYAVAVTVLGIASCFFVWLTGQNLRGAFGQLSINPFLNELELSSGPFIGGLVTLLFALLGGFAALFFSYFLAEFVVVIADIAINVRVLAQRQTQ